MYLLPEGPAWFPADMETDQPIEVVVAEFIREKILRSFHDEVPHAIGVRVDEMEYDKKKDLHRIFATVYVERDSQKGIIIGKKGAAIKQIGTEARADLEQLLGTRVYLGSLCEGEEELAPRREPDPPLRLRRGRVGARPAPAGSRLRLRRAPGIAARHGVLIRRYCRETGYRPDTLPRPLIFRYNTHAELTSRGRRMSMICPNCRFREQRGREILQRVRVSADRAHGGRCRRVHRATTCCARSPPRGPPPPPDDAAVAEGVRGGAPAEDASTTEEAAEAGDPADPAAAADAQALTGNSFEPSAAPTARPQGSGPLDPAKLPVIGVAGVERGRGRQRVRLRRHRRRSRRRADGHAQAVRRPSGRSRRADPATGLDECLVDSGYTPPAAAWRSGDTMEMPRVEGKARAEAEASFARPTRTREEARPWPSVVAIVIVLLVAAGRRRGGRHVPDGALGRQGGPRRGGHDAGRRHLRAGGQGLHRPRARRSSPTRRRASCCSPIPASGARAEEGTEVVIHVAVRAHRPRRGGQDRATRRPKLLEAEDFARRDVRRRRSPTTAEGNGVVGRPRRLARRRRPPRTSP